MTTSPDRTRYELLVERHLSPATLATFPVALTTTAVPRNRVRRLRVPGDRDLAEVVRRLTERRVQLLEIRRCPAPGDAPRRQEAPRIVSSPDLGSADLIPFPRPVPAPSPPQEAQPTSSQGRVASVTELAPSDGGGDSDVHAVGTMPDRRGARRVPRRRAPAEWKEDRR